jgi:hypothetical protein
MRFLLRKKSVSNGKKETKEQILTMIVITKIMFRWITFGFGAVKEYFFVKQDPACRPVASNRHLDGTTAQLPVTTCLSAGWGVAVCRAKTLVAVCQ